MRGAKKGRAKEGKKNLGGDTGKMKKRLNQKGIALFVVVLLFMAVMLVPAVSAREQDDTARAKVPSIIKVYSLVELNPTEILERINAGESVNISICGEPFELKLVPSNLNSPDCKAWVTDENGTYEIELEDPATYYRCKVVGEPDSRGSFTITPDWVSGTVSCDKGWYWIEPLNGWKKAEAGANVTHYTYNTADTEFEIYLGDDVFEIPEDDSISDISTIEPSNISVSSIANFEKTPKTSRYAPKAYNEWNRKSGKSKYYIERESNKAKVEVPSNFRVYNKRVTMKDVKEGSEVKKW